MPAEHGEALTERELEITDLVAEGLTNREVAARLHLSPNTIKVHLRNIFAKTGVASRTELTVLAMQEGWIDVPGVVTEESAAEQADEAPEPAPPWPRHRWIALAAGLALALLILLLPQIPTGRAASGPGVELEPGTPALDAPDPVIEDGWVELAPLPVRRGAMGVVAAEGRVYVVGGLTEEGDTGRLDIYNIGDDVWTQGAARPLALASIGAAALPEGILVPGGCNAAWQPSAAAHLYDPAEDTWREVAPVPAPVCAYALTTYQERAYLFGGWDGEGYRTSAYLYDPVEDAWQALPEPAQARGFGAAATLANRVFYIGGYDGKREWATCEVYLPAEARWEACAPMLQPRGGLGLAAAGAHLHAVGGGWNNYLGFNERYDPSKDRWTVTKTPIVGTWRNLGVTASDTDLYIVGGLGSEDFLNRVYTVEVLPVKLYIPVTFLSP